MLWNYFKEKVFNIIGNDVEYVSLQEIVEGIGSLKKDLSKVKFGWENSYYKLIDNWGGEVKFGPIQHGKLAFIGCQSGGDWEWPVYFAIYLDKNGKTLRGYIPNDGNPWNRDTKEAFGNDDLADDRFLRKWMKKNHPEEFDPVQMYSEYPDLMYDFDAIKQDISDRIEVIK